MLRVDLHAAGIPYRDGQGRFFEFHAFRRQSPAAPVGAAFHVGVPQHLLRHSKVALTMTVSPRPPLMDQQPSREALPPLPGSGPHAELTTLTATGTDGGEPRQLAV